MNQQQMEPKYKIGDITQEETDAFMKEFNELIEKHSVYFEPVPKVVRAKLGDPFTLGCDLVIQKKTLINESVPSDISELNTSNENNEEAD